LIVIAGPLATLALALGSFAALRLGSWPDGDIDGFGTSAGVAAERVLEWALGINAVALAINLLPLRRLDGGHLLSAVVLRLRRGPAPASRASRRS
jgi:membrane-associated protease RseP (regulator of RpoE activity)